MDTLGKLSDCKDWFFVTPTVVILNDGNVKHAWEENVPDLDTIVETMAFINSDEAKRNYCIKNITDYLSNVLGCFLWRFYR